jgi:hypothetical protein
VFEAVAARNAAAVSAVGSAIEGVSAVFADGGAARALVEGVAGSNLRLLDGLVPSALVRAQLAATARLASLAVPGTAFAGWRGSLLAEHVAAGLTGSAAVRQGPAAAEALAALERSTAAAARLSGLAVGRRGGAAGWPSALPASLLGEFVDGLGSGPSGLDVLAGASAGRGVAGLVAVDVLARPRGQGSDPADLFEDEVAAPWLDGPARARTELMDALASVDAALPELLEGAWEDVERQGRAAVVKIASCAVEALERALRALAPEDDVLAWHAAGGRPTSELSNGRPTHGCRVRYVLRDGKRGRLAAAQADAVVVQVNELRSALQAGKHASAAAVSSLRAHLLAVEAVLHQLVVVGR